MHQEHLKFDQSSYVVHIYVLNNHIYNKNRFEEHRKVLYSATSGKGINETINVFYQNIVNNNIFVIF